MEDLILKFNDKEFDAVFDKDDLNTININGKPFRVELLKKYHNNIFSFAVNQKLLQVELGLTENGGMLIQYDGLAYEVDVKNETRRLLEKFIKMSGAAAGAGLGVIKAPMPGLVVKYFVKEGDDVVKGDNIVIVEAMKMENSLKSPVSGRVTKISAAPGAPVNKDAVLMEIKEAVEI